MYRYPVVVEYQLVAVTSSPLHHRRRRLIIVHHLLVVIVVVVVEKFVGKTNRDAFVDAAQLVVGGTLQCLLIVSQTVLVTIVVDAENDEEYGEHNSSHY